MVNLEDAIEIVKRQVGSYLNKHTVHPTVQRDDLLQEALLRMFRYIPRYDPSKGDLGAFLEKHTHGAIVDFLRKGEGYSRKSRKTVVVSLTVYDDGNSGEETVMDIPDSRVDTEADLINLGELPKFLEIAMKTLSEKELFVLLLYYWEDITLKEIGDMLGVTESRVSQLQTKALNRLSANMYSMGFVRTSQLMDK